MNFLNALGVAAAALALLAPVALAEAPLVEMPATEAFRIGGENDADGHFFGVMTDVQARPAGGWVVLDRQLAELKAFSAEGDFLYRYGREGEAPGEFRQAGSFFMMPDGRTVVVQRRPGRLVLFGPEGAPLDDWALPAAGESGGFRMIQQAAPTDNGVFIQKMGFRREGNGGIITTAELQLIDDEGNAGAVLHSEETRRDMAKLVVNEAEGFQRPWIASNGRIYRVDGTTYKIAVHEADGGESSIGRPFEALIRDDARKEEVAERMKNGMRFRGPRGRIEFETVVLDYEPAIQYMLVDGAGRLWVQNARQRDAAKTTAGEFDIFSADGEWIARTNVDVPVDWDEDRVILRGDHFFVLHDFNSAIQASRGGRDGEDEDEDEDEDEEEEEIEAAPMELVAWKLPIGMLP